MLRTVLVVAGALGVAASFACTEPQAAGGSKDSSLSAIEEPLASLLVQYEQIRALLAKDDIPGAVAKALTLQEAAGKAASAPGAVAMLADVATSAAALGAASTADADAVRKAFGEVSRHLVAVLVARPQKPAGLHLFECPMAQGYTKWVQRTETIENPYMGPKMLECGAASEWKL